MKRFATNKRAYISIRHNSGWSGRWAGRAAAGVLSLLLAACSGSDTAGLIDGSECDTDAECSSGHCDNGVCCAEGDCCISEADCPHDVYGEPTTCADASSCQGTRVDPVCTMGFRCDVGLPVDDDSACAGLTAHECGLYPAVQCTDATDQPNDQGSLCAESCADAGDCDPGAVCDPGTGACATLGGQGDACVTTAQCNQDLQCSDGVCCDTACAGPCEACNVAGSEGTCTPLEAGTDPADECSGVSCADYAHGWSGDSCLARADAPDSEVDCNGAGACEEADDLCPGQPPGSPQIACDALCQAPNQNTCDGTILGVCDDVTPNPATETCGLGVCELTVDRCLGGVPNTCVPGTPGVESCNGLDDDCDGAVDEDLSVDIYETNGSCAQVYDLGTIYSISLPNEPNSITVTPSLYPAGDQDFFQVTLVENDTTCGCSFPSTDEDYSVTASLTVPQGAGSFELCLSQGNCNMTSCVTAAAGTTYSVEVWMDGCCNPFGCLETGDWFAVVRPMGAPGYSCESYTLTFTATQGCRS